MTKYYFIVIAIVTLLGVALWNIIRSLSWEKHALIIIAIYVVLAAITFITEFCWLPMQNDEGKIRYVDQAKRCYLEIIVKDKNGSLWIKQELSKVTAGDKITVEYTIGRILGKICRLAYIHRHLNFLISTDT